MLFCDFKHAGGDICLHIMAGFAHVLQMWQFSVFSLFGGEPHQASREIIWFGISRLLHSQAMKSQAPLFLMSCRSVMSVLRERCHALALTVTCFLCSRDQACGRLAKSSGAQPLSELCLLVKQLLNQFLSFTSGQLSLLILNI